MNLVVGEHDRLVPPKTGVFKYAKGYHVIKGPDSTHFGTAGGNDAINEVMANLLLQPKAYHKGVDYVKAKK